MHELSLMEGVLGIVQDAHSRHGFRRVTRVTLEVGELAGAETEALEFCWEVVAKGTVAESALVVLVKVPALAWCGACSAGVAVGGHADLCPVCGGVTGPVSQGLDLRVKSLEVD